MEIFESIFIILSMIALGVFIAWRLEFDEKKSSVISKLVLAVTLPAYMIYNITSNYDRETLIKMTPGLAFPFASMLLCFLLSILVARLLKVPDKRRGTFSSMFALSNTIFIGLPINLMLFGEKSIPFVLLFYIANTVLFWTIGVYGINRDGHIANGNNEKIKIFSLANIRKVFSPPLLGFILGVILVLIGFKLPRVILEVCKSVGNMTTPLSMIFIGIVLFHIEWKNIRVERSMIALVAARFLIAPFLIILLCHFAPLPVLMKKVFVIQASMPIMTQTSIVAKAYNADYKYAAVMTSVTTVASMLTIPLYMILMNSVNFF